jgi:alkylation response protein AidB-like acyl-CoA dehydrogenase
MDFALTKEQKELKERVAAFSQREIAPRAEALDRDGVFPTDLFHKLGDLGVLSIPFAEEWGGMGLGVMEATLALEEVARADQSLAVGAMVSIATGLTLARFGDRALAEQYLPDIVSGKRICSIAGTEPQAGSDTAGFITNARRDGDNWVLNGQKAYITNPGTDISSFAIVLVVTSPPSAPKKSFSLFLVPNGTKGYTQGEKYKKMGWRSSDTRPLYFDDCVLPASNMIGEVDKGRIILHRGYQQARLFLATCSLGLAQASLESAVKFAQERQAFGASLGKLQLIQDMVAHISIKVDAARMLVYRAAWSFGADGEPDMKDLSTAKYYATEVASECANLAIQVHGGWGYMDDCPPSRYLRDNRICTIGDGSSQIQLLLIARALGLDVRF